MARKSASGRTQVIVQPEGRIRQSQIVTTFGPGAMVDLVDHAVLVGGLNYWSFEDGARPVDEPRLRDAIARRFEAIGRQLRFDRAFLEPPAGDDSDPSRACGIRVLEFPRWFVCQNRDCRALIRCDHLEIKRGKYTHRCDDGKNGEFVPVRFVAACKRGHLDEFPWSHFVHGMQGRESCASPKLRLTEGATGDFSEIRVSCACGAQALLSTVMAEDVSPRCWGHRPWLGPEGEEECKEPTGEPGRIRLLVRTASNSYFSQVVSALSIPEKGREIERAVRAPDVYRVLKDATTENMVLMRTLSIVKGAIEPYTDAEVLAVVDAIRNEKSPPREPIRTAEFRQFIAAKPEKPGDLPDARTNFYVRTTAPEGGALQGVKRVVLAHKLREVRVQVGFTRIESATANLQGEFDLGVQSAALGLATDWLPGSEVRGEGVFIQLDEDAVRAWENRPPVLERGRELLRGYERWKATVANAPDFLGVRFYLLHSLAHLLLSAVSLECGYAASSIRERIYCSPSNDDPPMAAILLSTGTSGTEGTLGGLVEQGRRLRAHLRHAFDLGGLCSNDPVCAAHSPATDPTERWLEGAACHGCLFVAECSCERFNRYLDRALVVPTIGRDPALAFFSERP